MGLQAIESGHRVFGMVDEVFAVVGNDRRRDTDRVIIVHVMIVVNVRWTRVVGCG